MLTPGASTPRANPGAAIFLADDEVTQEKIEDAFRKIAAAVRNSPQDKVVVFLAGHTGVFNTNRFCLLLPKYPFPADAPTWSPPAERPHLPTPRSIPRRCCRTRSWRST